MKKKLTNNFGFKILSLVLAVLLWLVVLGIEDPVYTREFSDISVTEINGDQITEAGKAYSFSGGDTVSVRVKGKTSVVSKITKDDLLAVADLSNLSITGAVMVDVSCPRYPSVDITPIGSSTMLKVTIEDLQEKSLNVRVVLTGSAGDGYFIGQGVATPNMVKISGPASEVNKVSEAVVYISVSSSNVADITTNTELTLLNSEGNAVTSSTISVSQTDISVEVPVYRTKTVPIEFGVTGMVADGYELISAVYEPKEVTVAGRAGNLTNITSVVMNDYDVTGLDAGFEASVNISDNLAESLPEGIMFTDKEATVALVADIQKDIVSSFELPLSRITLIGNSQDYSYTKNGKLQTDKTITVTVSGPESEIKALTVDSMKASVDVSGLGAGEHSLPLNLSLEGNLALTQDVYLSVLIEDN